MEFNSGSHINPKGLRLSLIKCGRLQSNTNFEHAAHRLSNLRNNDLEGVRKKEPRSPSTPIKETRLRLESPGRESSLLKLSKLDTHSIRTYIPSDACD